jgi:hypothetical protein
MIPWLSANFKNFKPNAAIALNATRHMNKIERKKLFSPDIEPMRTAEGRWFEAIVYEMFLDISKKSSRIKYLARKGADAPRKREDVKLGQNGLFYSKYGDITIRGNGQDLAEFDMLLVDSDNDSSGTFTTRRSLLFFLFHPLTFLTILLLRGLQRIKRTQLYIRLHARK